MRRFGVAFLILSYSSWWAMAEEDGRFSKSLRPQSRSGRFMPEAQMADRLAQHGIEHALMSRDCAQTSGRSSAHIEAPS